MTILPVQNDITYKSASPNARVTPVFLSENGYLSIGTNGTKACFGKWLCHIDDITAETYYNITVKGHYQDIVDPLEHLHALVSWCDTAGKPLQRDYLTGKCENGQVFFERILLAPPLSDSCVLELCFKWSETGSIQWFDAAYTPVAPLVKRNVRVVSAYVKPPGGKEANLASVLNAIDHASVERPDILCLSETELSYGVSFETGAVVLHGDETARIGEKAKQYAMYIVIGLSIVEEGVYHNCAVLFDRDGKIAGVHRKIQLPLIEAEWGYTPGDDICVFQTDFGKIGMVVCWDLAHPELTRALVKQGAEIIFNPSQWHASLQIAARAADNGVFTVLSATWYYDTPCQIYNPYGELIASAVGNNEIGYCVAEIDLNRMYVTRWLSVGDADAENKTVLQTEFRTSLY